MEIERILSIQPREIEKYTAQSKVGLIQLETAFNNAIYTNLTDLKSLNEKVILKVELIYTTYRKSESFDQHGLNRKRLNALFTAAPNVMKQAGINWVLTAQTGCTSAEMGTEFFHGLVITYREKPSKSITEIEKRFLKEVASGTIKPHVYDSYLKNELKKEKADSIEEAKIDPVIKLPEFVLGERARIDFFTKNLRYPSTGDKVAERVDVQMVIDKTGKISGISFPGTLSTSPYHEEVLRFIQTMPNWRPGTVDNKPVDCMVQFSVDFMSRGSIIPSPLEVYALDSPSKTSEKRTSVDYSKIKPQPNSNSVEQTLAKNDWKNAVLVCDATGSMAQYNAQVMVFLEKAIAKKDSSYTSIVFFNDGDNALDRNKKTGKVGGIYPFSPTTSESILEKLLAVMEAGNGGDLEENNIEALIKTEQLFPNCKSIVMIADNFATPRDMSLLNQLKKPVHVIVCGASPILNENYLTIAYVTKGSVHFNNKDITNIHTFEEGATVQVGKETFVLKKEKFVKRN